MRSRGLERVRAGGRLGERERGQAGRNRSRKERNLTSTLGAALPVGEDASVSRLVRNGIAETAPGGRMCLVSIMHMPFSRAGLTSDKVKTLVVC